MKKATLILLSVMLFSFTTAFAQKAFIGTVTSKVIIEGTDDPNILSQIPENTTTYIYENRTKTVQDLGGASLAQITNGDAKVSIIFFDIPGLGKYYAEMTEADLNKAHEKVETKYNYTGEMKMIAGYNCEKVIETIIDKETDEETTVTLYVSKDFCANPAINFSTHDGLVGYPLRTERKVDMNGTEVTQILEAVSVTPSKKVKLAEFLPPTDGKKFDSVEEMFRTLMGTGEEDEDE
ncbi:MAG: hypothetical protein K6A95_01050 [Bacteroidales bacterium]|nr:hypothetical protein [Bacteroidales bacterium]